MHNSGKTLVEMKPLVTDRGIIIAAIIAGILIGFGVYLLGI